MPEAPHPPRTDMKPAWRAASLAYRSARGEGHGDHNAHNAAVAAVLELHPELTREVASAEVVCAVAYASSFHTDWFWAPLRKRIAAEQPQ